MKPLWIVIGICLVIIISYFFNILAKRYSIPSVIMLILTGFGINQWFTKIGIDFHQLFPLLEILGTIGLIMIVLEAAIDLKLTAKNTGNMAKAFLIALVAFCLSSLLIASLLHWLLGMTQSGALLHAIPLSVISSAIVIPSVAHLSPNTREFMIYDSTFSDIIGITAFYFMVDASTIADKNEVLVSISSKMALTIIASIVLSYAMVVLFQKVKSHGKLLLMVAILILLYAIGKLFHLSSLIIILLFGLVLNNKRIFFRGFMKNWVRFDDHEGIQDFRLITIEGSFFIRTFFFVLFGMSISLQLLSNPLIYGISIVILGAMYLIRYFTVAPFIKENLRTVLFIAPRGLISILLFFAIPENLQSEKFNPGILLLIIITSSIIMMFTLMQRTKEGKIEDVESLELDVHGGNIEKA